MENNISRLFYMIWLMRNYACSHQRYQRYIFFEDVRHCHYLNLTIILFDTKGPRHAANSDIAPFRV